MQAHNFYMWRQDSQVSVYYKDMGMKNCAETLKFFWISRAELDNSGKKKMKALSL